MQSCSVSNSNFNKPNEPTTDKEGETVQPKATRKCTNKSKKTKGKHSKGRRATKSSEPQFTPAPKPSSKRVLSSPLTPEEYIKKRNKFQNVMSDLESSMDEGSAQATGGQDPDVLAASQTHITIPESDLQKMSEFIRPTVQGDILSKIMGDLRTMIKSAVSEVIDEKLDQLRFDNSRLEEENKKLRDRVDKLELAMDESEQYSRRNSLRISNIAETPDENTDQLVYRVAEIIGVNLSSGDIDRSHRVGKRGVKPRRDIIVKLSTYRARERLFKNRSKLKNSELNGTFINEDLTKSRSELLYQARQRVRSKLLLGAWSSDGRILVKGLDGKINRISSMVHLDNACGNDSTRDR